MAPVSTLEARRIARPAVAARIAAALRTGSVVLTAGAGYGKTTALQEGIAAAGLEAAWLYARPGDEDAGRLLLHLIDVVDAAVPGPAAAVRERMGGAHSFDPQETLRTLLGELDRILLDPLVVVVDDAERLAEAPAALGLVEALLRESGPVRAAVATRRTLPLRTAKLRVSGRLTEVREAELGFTAAECAALLAASGGAAEPATVDELMQRTRGWPLGIALSTLTGDRARADLRPDSDIFAFLDEEVLGNVEPDLRDDLIDASIAEELSADALAALGLPPETAARAEAHGLPLHRVPGRPHAFTLHPLLAEFLRTRLQQERTEDRRCKLRARLGDWLARNGRRADAIDAWLAAGAWEPALATMTGAVQELLRTSPASVRRWLDALPAQARSAPVALLLEGQLHAATGQPARALDAAMQALVAFRAQGDAGGDWATRLVLMETLYWGGEFERMGELAGGFDNPALRDLGALPAVVAAWGAVGLAAAGAVRASEELAARVQAAAPAEDLQGVLGLHDLYAAAPRGESDRALRHLEAVLADPDRRGPFDRREFAYGTLIFVHFHLGRMDEALAAAEAMKRAGEGGLVPYTQRLGRAAKTWLLVFLGRPAEAEIELADVEPARPAPWAESLLVGAQAGIAAWQGQESQALAHCQAAADAARRGPVLFRVMSTLTLAPILAACGERRRAEAVVAETLQVLDERLPGATGSFSRALLLAMRAWLLAERGDTAGATESLIAALSEAGTHVDLLLRLHWGRVEPLVWAGLEQGRFAAEEVLAALSRAFPDGGPLLAFSGHAQPAVRAAAAAPLAHSGHPEAGARLKALSGDPEPAVAAAAERALAVARREPPPLTVSVLGGFRVLRGRWEVDEKAWRRPMAARLVRYLLVHEGRPVPEEELLEAFWPETPPESARSSLQVTVSRARAVLDGSGAERSAITMSERAYRLELRPGDRVDARRFLDAAERALAARGPGRAGELRRAAALWTGEPLPEDRYAEWARSWRDHLMDRHRAVLRALLEEHGAAGRHADAVTVGRRLLDLDTLDEGVHRELMAAYARAGRVGHALRQYLECRRVLVEELGLEPSEATTALQRRILAGEPV